MNDATDVPKHRGNHRGGASGTCPDDAKSTGVCRPAADVCDVAESCEGVSNACPADGFAADLF